MSEVVDLSAKIARFVVDTSYENIPPEALDTAKTAFLDCLGVAVAGSKEGCAKICAEIARQESSAGEAAVFGRGFRSSALQAAFANGTAAHALDYDHSFTLMGQPTAPIIPAMVSLGETLGASGRRLLEAYVAGFEVTAKLALSLRDSTQDGWHGPGTVGSIGAAAACAKLLQLSASQVAMALGVTASMASGVVANFGTMTKPLHVGLAARNGVLAAKLAQAGYTANVKALEAGGGFYETYYRSTPANGPLDELGEAYALVNEGIKIKFYPCGGLTHTAIDAVLDMRARHSISPDQVDSIEACVSENTFNRIVFRVPETGLQGKFCMGYLLARALIDGKLSIDTFTDTAVRDLRVLELAAKVNMKLAPNLKPSATGSRPSKVTIRLKDGKSFSSEIIFPKGSGKTPLSAAELEAKFVECARQAIGESSIQPALEYVKRLETMNDIRPLCQLLMG